jgi:hypothetical protein
MALVASLLGAARNDGSQKAHFIRRRIQFSDTLFNTGAKIGRIPARSFIQQVSIHKVTAFNSATSDNITLGSNATGVDILASTAITGTGFVNLSAAAGLGMAVTSETDVFLRWVASTGSTQPTSAGDVTVLIVFSPDNDG